MGPHPNDREPTATVVIAVWDAPYVDTYPRALRSVLAQDPDTRVVVVDNCSSVELPEPDGPTVVRSPRRVSAGMARNLGLEHVETEFVIFLDADDELLPGALARLVDGIAGAPGSSAFVSRLLEADTGEVHRFPRRFVGPLSRLPRVFAFVTAVWSLYPLHGCAILRTAWVRAAGGHADCEQGEDSVLAVSQAMRGPIRLDPRPGLLYHRSGDEVLGARSMRSVHRRIRDRIRSDPGIPEWARRLLPVIHASQLIVDYALLPFYRFSSARLRALRHAR